MLVSGVILLLIGVVAWRAPAAGGALFLIFGVLMLLFLGSWTLYGDADRFMFLVAVLPFGALVILAGALNLRLGFKQGKPGQGSR